MKDDRQSLESLFRGLRPPAAPLELREQVLSQARGALATRLAPDRWTVMWESLGLRLAWTVAVSILVLGNVLIPGLKEAAGGPPALPLAISVREGGDELADVAKLPRIDPAARSLGATVPSPTATPESPLPRGPSGPNRKETSS